MQDTPTPRELPTKPTPMPPVIAKAVMEAIDKIEASEQTGEGEEEATARTFRYTSINDVLGASHEALKEVGLHVAPIEAHCETEAIGEGALVQVWAHYQFRFRYIEKKTGTSWIDEEDTRHISLQISGNGMNAGKAQSLAMRDYYKGLLRIRTIEPEDGEEAGSKNVSRETSTNAPKRAAPKKGAIAFDFGPQGGGMKGLTPPEVRERFEKEIASLSPELRKQWEASNEAGLRELSTVAKKIWLDIRKVLDTGAKE